MHKARPRFNYQAVMGYAPIDAKVEVTPVPETVDEAVRLAVQEIDNPHLQKWYMSKIGQYWLKYGLDASAKVHNDDSLDVNL